MWPATLKAWAKALERDVIALHLAARDPRVPWHAKAVAAVTAAYALSPIDLIPDFIPVLGQLDDLLLLPLGIILAVKLIPREIMAEHRAAAITMEGRLVSRTAAAMVVATWVGAAGFLTWLSWPKPAF